MPLIGEGSYGCIFKPIVTCQKKINVPKNTIGKVFVDYSEFDLEKTIQYKIKKIDPNNEFTIPLYNICDIAKFSKKDEVNKCTLISNKENTLTEYPQLIYKYGGKDLKNIYKNEKGSVLKFMNLFIKFRPLLVGLKKMINVKYVHQDIKPPNILYDKKADKLYLIDFGILTYSNDIYTHGNSYVLKYDYPYYPPEYKLYNHIGSFNKYYNKIIKNYNFDFLIGKNHVDLLWIINEYIGVDVINDLRTIYNNPKNVFNPSKIDIFSIGIVILELYIWSKLYNKKFNKNTPIKQLQEKLNLFLRGLIRFNSLERYDINKVISAFDDIVYFWNNIK